MPNVINLSDDISCLKGIGGKKKGQLASAGIYTVEDLLEYYPVKYKDRRNVIRAIDAATESDSLVAGTLIKTGFRPLSSGRSMIECTLKDESCIFYAVFFNMPYLRKSLSIGKKYVLFGRMRLRNGSKVWTNPEMTPEGGERDIRGIIPIYRHTSGLSDVNIRKWIEEALGAEDLTYEWIDPDIIENRKLCGRAYAFKNIHFPTSEQHYKTAKYRLNYETLLKYQLAVRINRKELEDDSIDAAVKDTQIDKFIESLPFELTEDQLSCIDEMGRDLSAKRPMNRLVQGDVGSGKTVVAEVAIYRCAKCGMQSAMMVPTEILARQHYEHMRADLDKFGIKSALLVSGMKSSEKKEVLDMTRSGDIDLLIGTHALIQKEVIFSNLALVITDEQHRFGVDQRKMLMEKGRAANICVMSATPIPRTLAHTVFGDMDFSIIHSMPGGRKKIITRALEPSARERAYASVRDEIEKGHQAYIVAPTIESDDDELISVNKLFEEVRGRFRGSKAVLLHGRMKSEEKEAVMNEFASGGADILVSTIVIEVGVDVANASIMVIENSERFGLAQLHQLRGRVGRSDIQSYCYIINYGKSESAIARARAMAEISDGFEISELDYEMRGPGDVSGTAQSGNINSNILSLASNTSLLEAVTDDADYIMSNESGCDMEYIRSHVMIGRERGHSDII